MHKKCYSRTLSVFGISYRAPALPPPVEDSSPRNHAGPPTAQPSWMSCYAIRLRPGQELKGALADFTSNHKIRVRHERGRGDGPVRVLLAGVMGATRAILSRATTVVVCVGLRLVYCSASLGEHLKY